MTHRDRIAAFLLCLGALVCISGYVVHKTIHTQSSTDSYSELLMGRPSGAQQQIMMSNENRIKREALGGENNRCLTPDGLRDMIHSTKQVVITMPAKAAGSSMQAFAIQCNGDSYGEISNNILREVANTEKILTNTFKVPAVIAGHIHETKRFVDIIKNVPSHTLLIHLHRKEMSRVVSAAKHVFVTRYCELDWGGRRSEYFDEVVGNSCYISEKKLVSILKKRPSEIAHGNIESMSCEAHAAIDLYGPTMVFADYAKADQIQRLIAEKYCPDVSTVHTNIGTQRSHQVYVRLKEGGANATTFDDWLETKSHALEFTLRMNDQATCVAKTRRVEKELFSCSDGYMGL